MTDREKIMAVIEETADEWEVRNYSVTIHDSGIKLIFTKEGEIKSVIRGGKSYGPEGVR